MDNTRKKKWLLRKKIRDGKYPFGDKARGDDEQDVTPWSNKQRSEKPYQSGVSGPSIVDESDPSYPTQSQNMVGEGVLKTYLGTPGMDYPTQSHHGI